MFEPYRPRKLDVADLEPEEMELPSGEYTHWHPHELGHGTIPRNTGGDITQDQDHGTQRENGYEEGFQQGLADGQKQARELLAQQTQQLQSAMSALREPARWIDHQLESELLSLTINLAQQLLRQQIDTDPERLLHIIKEAVSRLPATNNTLTINLNPADYALLQKVSQESDSDGKGSLDSSWQLIEDASISPGGSVIHSGDSLIDDTVENRLAGLVERMLEPDKTAAEHTNDGLGNDEGMEHA